MASKKLPKVLTKMAAQKFIDSIHTRYPTGVRNKSMILFMYRAGLRVAEVVNLMETDVNLQDHFVLVQQGKGGKDRYIPIDGETVEWVEKWLEKKREMGLNCPYLYCTHKNKKIDTRYVRDVCYRLSERSGVFVQKGKEKRPVSPHVLRHCYGTELLEEGFNIREVQDLLGHSNINTTMLYTHIRPEVLASKVWQRGGEK